MLLNAEEIKRIEQMPLHQIQSELGWIRSDRLHGGPQQAEKFAFLQERLVVITGVPLLGAFPKGI